MLRNLARRPPSELSSFDISAGQFGIPAGQVFSVPVLFQSGTWEMPTDIVIDEELRGKLEAAVEQLREVSISLLMPEKRWQRT
ncbi:hypothetical protein Z043_113803 [Scleropages formosus]|uniref:Lactate/malate dehydrogenase C-terminal domain-containing protein n=1 Tax=Scleropages formosus TaxID=113540 RepID=A0A0N8JYV4_SCLFO|nr:hypothetical protein Z043_113803 [Scleropages formosus]